MIDIDRCRAVLVACLPELSAGAIRHLGEGWDSVVFLVDDDLLVRFPKRADAGRALEREARLLPELAPLLPVPIPLFLQVVRRCSEYPWTFAAYRRVAGVPADQASLDDDRKAALAMQIGVFLRALHAFPLRRAAALEVAPADGAHNEESFSKFAGAVGERVGPLLRRDERRQLAAWFELADARGILTFSPALIHGDVGAPHLLVDPASGGLAGVIDFGDAGIGDPAIDVAGLLTMLDERAMRAVLAAYGHPDDKALLTRARLHYQLFPVYDILFGLSTGEEAYVRDGLAGLRTRMLNPVPHG